jgi:hypothetical protein
MQRCSRPVAKASLHHPYSTGFLHRTGAESPYAPSSALWQAFEGEGPPEPLTGLRCAREGKIQAAIVGKG